MLTHILHNAEQLCAFIDHQDLDLSQPQRRHLVNVVDALLGCESRKTLAALRRQLVEGRDVSTMADCLRSRPWTAALVRQPLGTGMVRWAIQRAARAGVPTRSDGNRDDVIAPKPKATRHRAGVDWQYDQLERTKRQPRYKTGLTSLACTVAGATNQGTFAVRR
jgi:hypothetical protein